MLALRAQGSSDVAPEEVACLWLRPLTVMLTAATMGQDARRKREISLGTL